MELQYVQIDICLLDHFHFRGSFLFFFPTWEGFHGYTLRSYQTWLAGKIIEVSGGG